MSTPPFQGNYKGGSSLGRKTVRFLMEDAIPERNKKQPFCSFRELLKPGNLVLRRVTTSLSGEENQPAARNTQDQYPRYQDEGKQLTKGPTSFPRPFSVEEKAG